MISKYAFKYIPIGTFFVMYGPISACGFAIYEKITDTHACRRWGGSSHISYDKQFKINWPDVDLPVPLDEDFVCPVIRWESV